MIVVDTADRQLFPGKYDWITVKRDSLFECELGDSVCYYNFAGERVVFRDVEVEVIRREGNKFPCSAPVSMEWRYVRGNNGYERQVFMGYKSEEGIEYWDD